MTAPSQEPERITLPLDEDLQRSALDIYAPDCRYVLGARLSHPADTRMATTADPSSWLRLDARCSVVRQHHRTANGHLDAATLCVLCEQMLDLTVVAALRHRLLPVPARSSEDFDRHMPDVLIADYQARFRRPLMTPAFGAWLAITSVEPQLIRDVMLLKVRAACTDTASETCDAQFTVALVDWPAIGSATGSPT